MSDMRAADFVLHARRTYNGWLIIGVVFLASALAIGTSTYAFGQFIGPLERHFGWQRTVIAASLSFMAVSAITSPLIGRLMDRYGARQVMTMSLVVFGLSFLLRPLMTQVWHWYVLSFIQFVVFTGTCVLPAGRLVGIWFPTSRGRLMGLTMMGNNFGGLTIPFIVWFVLATASWKEAFLVVAAISFVLALLALVVVRDQPDHGLASPGKAQVDRPAVDSVLEGSTVREALRTRDFYTITLAITLGSFTYTGVIPWLSAHLASEGMAAAVVPRAVAALAVSGMIGKLAFGYIADRSNARHAMMLCLGGQIFAILLLVGYPSSPHVWVSVPLYGLSMGAFGVLITLIVQESFGLRYFGSISGLSMMAMVVPDVAGPLMAGASSQITGSYGTSFVTIAALFAIAIAVLTQVRRPNQLQQLAG